MDNKKEMEKQKQYADSMTYMPLPTSLNQNGSPSYTTLDTRIKPLDPVIDINNLSGLNNLK
jgi:hypothetical protein